MEDLHREVEVITELARKSIFDRAHGSMNQDDWAARNSGYQERHKQVMERITQLEDQKHEKQHKSKVIDYFIRNLSEREKAIDTFDEQILITAIDRVEVETSGKLTFQFKNGTEICR